jgi:hypothetical protein
MKKMAIVPYKMLEEIHRWKTEHRPQLPPSPNLVQTVELQEDMSSVLDRNDISETEKAQKYGETLQKFQLAHKKALHPTTTTEMSATTTTNETVPESSNNPTLRERILESVPSTTRRKAKLLLQMIERHPQMSYNENGELEYAGKPVPGSNIIDLVNDVLRHRKSFLPQGWEVFSRGLKEINVPQEFVGNRQRWLYMQKRGRQEEDELSEDDEFFDTSNVFPDTPPPSSKKAIKRDPGDPWASHSAWEPY